MRSAPAVARPADQSQQAASSCSTPLHLVCRDFTVEPPGKPTAAGFGQRGISEYQLAARHPTSVPSPTGAEIPVAAAGGLSPSPGPLYRTMNSRGTGMAVGGSSPPQENTGTHGSSRSSTSLGTGHEPGRLRGHQQGYPCRWKPENPAQPRGPEETATPRTAGLVRVSGLAVARHAPAKGRSPPPFPQLGSPTNPSRHQEGGWKAEASPPALG